MSCPSLTGIVLEMGLGIYTESTDAQRLTGVLERRGSQTGSSTLVMFLFGSPFIGFGSFFTLAGMKIVHVDPRSVHAPYWVLAAAGLVFVFGGVMVWNLAWTQFLANRRKAQAIDHHINEPALEDYDWDPRGFGSHQWMHVAKGIPIAGFLAVFLSIFNWWAWVAQGPLMVKIVVSLFDLILVFVCWQIAMAIGRALKFGSSRIEFVRFPYRANDQITIRWLTPSGIKQADKGAFTLRCVKEWYETTASGRGNSKVLVHEQQWAGRWALEHPEDFLPGKNVDLDFKPPAGIPATCLDDAKPVFWEFEVNLSLPGLDFKETYLVPVY